MLTEYPSILRPPVSVGASHLIVMKGESPTEASPHERATYFGVDGACGISPKSTESYELETL